VNLSAPFETEGEHIAIDLPGARALFTTRRGGYSTGPYESLNLGLLTDDDPDSVARNRALLTDETGVALAYIRQVHGTKVLEAMVERPGREADGEVTAERGVGTIVMTADCLPIAIAGGGAVGMVHAGWRGLADGVIANGIGALRRLAGGGALHAAIGPGAGPCCYEVGEEVHARFGGRSRNGHNLDLKAIAREQLARAGAEVVHDVAMCTICSDPSLFFSHRRDHGVTGRQGGIAWLT
jgi:YfiH family protein